MGLAIGVIGKPNVPTRWAIHAASLSHRLPGGLFHCWVYAMADFSSDPSQNYASLRTQVVEQAKERDCRWLLFVDTDVFLPFDAVCRLMRHGEAIVSGVYWTKTEPSAPVVIEEFGNGPAWKIEPSDKLLPIDASGLGCCLIDMKVFDAFDRAGIPYFGENWMHGANGREVSVEAGEDYYFFLQARELGFQAYADTNVLCEHYDEKQDRFFPKAAVLGKIARDSTGPRRPRVQSGLERKFSLKTGVEEGDGIFTPPAL